MNRELSALELSNQGEAAFAVQNRRGISKEGSHVGFCRAIWTVRHRARGEINLGRIEKHGPRPHKNKLGRLAKKNLVSQRLQYREVVI